MILELLPNIVHLLQNWNLHLPKTNMEPKNQPIEKECHIPNLHVWVQNVNFPGVCSMQKIPQTHLHLKLTKDTVAMPR